MIQRKRLKDMTEPEIRDLMSAVGRSIDLTARNYLPPVPRPMFVLLLFNDPQVAQYIASCDRSTMVQALREAADRLQRSVSRLDRAAGILRRDVQLGG